MKRMYEMSESELRQAIAEWFLRHHEYDVDPASGIRFGVTVDCECNPEDIELGDVTADVTTEDEPIGAES